MSLVKKSSLFTEDQMATMIAAIENGRFPREVANGLAAEFGNSKTGKQLTAHQVKIWMEEYRRTLSTNLKRELDEADERDNETPINGDDGPSIIAGIMSLDDAEEKKRSQDEAKDRVL